MTHYSNYQEWRHAIVDKGGFTLDREYCEERIATFEDDSLPETRTFLNLFGEAHRQQIIGWFKQALSEV